MNAIDALREGRKHLDPVLRLNGFSFVEGPSGPSSGGPFASGAYVSGDRKLEIHFRHSLGLVTYHMGTLWADHESYMRALLGREGGNKFPDFSENALSQFENLAYDLQHFCSAFLTGDEAEFRRCVEIAERQKKLSAFERLSQSES